MLPRCSRRGSRHSRGVSAGSCDRAAWRRHLFMYETAHWLLQDDTLASGTVETQSAILRCCSSDANLSLCMVHTGTVPLAHLRRGGAILSLLLLLAPLTAEATTITWNGGGADTQ